MMENHVHSVGGYLGMWRLCEGCQALWDAEQRELEHMEEMREAARQRSIAGSIVRRARLFTELAHAEIAAHPGQPVDPAILAAVIIADAIQDVEIALEKIWKDLPSPPEPSR